MGGCGFAVQSFAPSFQRTFNDPDANCGEARVLVSSSAAASDAQSRDFTLPI
jgi:hypothetical protein